MLCVLAKSGLDLLTPSTEVQPTEEDAGLASMMQSAAVAQLLLVLLTFTSYHVQIISRLSSGYPLWYLWLARRLFHQKTTGGGTGIVTFMVMYASIQGVLFASFLPPA
jgi:phosphatidylinositol glycan class V